MVVIFVMTIRGVFAFVKNIAVATIMNTLINYINILHFYFAFVLTHNNYCY